MAIRKKAFLHEQDLAPFLSIVSLANPFFLKRGMHKRFLHTRKGTITLTQYSYSALRAYPS